MPIPSGTKMPEEKVYESIEPDVYEAVIDDIEYEVKPSPFKNEDGSAQEDIHQYKVKFCIKEGKYNDRWVSAWLRCSLRKSTKSKRPTLPQFLKAVTGQDFGPEDHEKVDGDFMNSLIGSKVRITTTNEMSKDGSKEYTVISAYLASKLK